VRSEAGLRFSRERRSHLTLSPSPCAEPSELVRLEVGGSLFSTGWDSATFWDKGTEVSSLSQDKGTTRRAQNLATGWDRTERDAGREGTGQEAGRDNHYQVFCQNPQQDAGRGGTIKILFPMISCFRTSFPVLEFTFPGIEQCFPVFVLCIFGK
jgi:hypothetical protein